MNRDIVGILDKQMTKAEFLRYLGVISLSVFGISSFLNNISSLDPKKPVKQVSNGKRTFGSGAYGV